MEQAKGAVGAELHRRAVEGWDEPIYGGRCRKRIVGTTRKYSDRLLELRAKALLPEYRDQRRLELAGGLDVRKQKSAREKYMEALARLTPEDRDRLREILVKAMRKPEPVAGALSG